MAHKYSGRFISFEGGEGAGKSTQARRLSLKLQALGLRVFLTREPGGAPTAEDIRNFWLRGGASGGPWDALTETLLVCAARREHLVHSLWPAMERGEWVISDRFADSTLVYQGAGLGQDISVLEELHRMVAGNFQPDLTLILDIDPAQGLQRIQARASQDRYERQDPAFHLRLHAGFHALAKKFPQRMRVIDSRQSEEAVAADIWQTVRRHFALPEAV